MIGAGELALMKPTAILVNTCRGPVIDEPALVRALGDGKLFGAGLDVFDQEPTPADNPLLKLDNVVLTAHFAGPTWDNHVARFRNAFDNVQRVARGEPALWVVPELAIEVAPAPAKLDAPFGLFSRGSGRDAMTRVRELFVAVRRARWRRRKSRRILLRSLHRSGR